MAKVSLVVQWANEAAKTLWIKPVPASRSDVSSLVLAKRRLVHLLDSAIPFAAVALCIDRCLPVIGRMSYDCGAASGLEGYLSRFGVLVGLGAGLVSNHPFLGMLWLAQRAPHRDSRLIKTLSRPCKTAPLASAPEHRGSLESHVLEVDQANCIAACVSAAATTCGSQPPLHT